MAAPQNYSGALAVRFSLGVFEGAVIPYFALFTSQVSSSDRPMLARFNPDPLLVAHKERTRHKGWHLVQLERVCSNLRWPDCLCHRQGRPFAQCGQISSWKIVFKVTGLLTVTVGALFPVFMSDNQSNSR